MTKPDLEKMNTELSRARQELIKLEKPMKDLKSKIRRLRKQSKVQRAQLFLKIKELEGMLKPYEMLREFTRQMNEYEDTLGVIEGDKLHKLIESVRNTTDPSSLETDVERELHKFFEENKGKLVIDELVETINWRSKHTISKNCDINCVGFLNEPTSISYTFKNKDGVSITKGHLNDNYDDDYDKEDDDFDPRLLEKPELEKPRDVSWRDKNYDSDGDQDGVWGYYTQTRRYVTYFVKREVLTPHELREKLGKRE